MKDIYEIQDNFEEYDCEMCEKLFDIEVEHYVRYSTKRSLREMPADWNGDEEDYDG